MIRERTERSQIIMAKWSKKLLGLAAIGSAAAGLVYYLKKSKKNEDDDFNDDLKTKTSIWIMTSNQLTVDMSI